MITKLTILKKIFSSIESGTIILTFPDGTSQTYGYGRPSASFVIKNKKAISALISEGDIGFGRGYIENWWETDNLMNLLDVLIANIKHIENAIYGNRLYNTIYKIYDFLHKNTLGNSKKNIEYHYDLGNDFYFKWLDETKSYSSALFFSEESLEKAQKAKYANIIKHILDAKNILEIGCGWGGFMQEMLNHNPDVKIKGLTLSNEQFAYVQEKFAGNQRIDPVIQDYRLESGMYDAIVSIEMFEAVGREYWKTYMQKIHDCLYSGGVAVIQTITINQEVFEKYVHTSDFIRHFIFPGGVLPTAEIFQNLAKDCGFEVIKSENFGQSYRKTLLLWLDKFDDVKEKIFALGFDEKFVRKWRMYLAYCASGFGFERTDVYQFVLRKI